MRMLCVIWVLQALLASAHSSPYVVSPAALQQAPYAEWAHYHWVWLDHTRGTQKNVMQFVDDWAQHNITIGAVNVDSTWATDENTYVFDPTKFPQPGDMIKQLHGRNLNVIFWTTSMMDTTAANYDFMAAQEYFIKGMDGKPGVIKWWHGHGSLLDYTNPEALKYWHSLLDGVLNLGADGWKVDGTDPYIMELIVPKGYQNKTVTWPQYAELTYGDFFDYARKVAGDHALIMSRPVDGYDWNGVGIFIPYSPRRVVFSGWVGDQDATFPGLREALRRIYLSAFANYVNFGSDVGGYRGNGGPRPFDRSAELLIRWAQMGACVPLFENGGDGYHAPWHFDDPGKTVYTDIYRLYVDLHMEMVPYLLSLGTNAYYGNLSAITPFAERPKTPFVYEPKRWDYMLGSTYYVHPVVMNHTTNPRGWQENVTFPQIQVHASEQNDAQQATGARLLRQRASVDGEARVSIAPGVVLTVRTGAQLSAESQWYSVVNASGSVLYQPGTSYIVDTPLWFFPVYAPTGQLIPVRMAHHQSFPDAWSHCPSPMLCDDQLLFKVRSPLATHSVSALEHISVAFEQWSPESGLWKDSMVSRVVHRMNGGVSASYVAVTNGGLQRWMQLKVSALHPRTEDAVERHDTHYRGVAVLVEDVHLLEDDVAHQHIWQQLSGGTRRVVPVIRDDVGALEAAFQSGRAGGSLAFYDSSRMQVYVWGAHPEKGLSIWLPVKNAQ